MFRLTAVLVAGLYATMVIWGDAPESDVTVTRAEGLSPAVAGLGAGVPVAAEAAASQEDASTLTEREALQAALEATETPAAPIEAAAPPRPAPEEDGEDLWYVTGTRVNLRSGPSSDSAIIGGVSIGDRAEVLSDPGESWIRIRTEAGLEAWIYGRFLSETPT